MDFNKVQRTYFREYPFLKGYNHDFCKIFRKKSSLLKQLRIKSEAAGFTEQLCPILTGNDCEGGGEAFSIQDSENFFGTKTYLTVSAQLHLEASCANEKGVYTIAPVFRAEKHDSKRHLAEFWMYEAEIAFPDSLHELMDVCEKLYLSSRLYLDNDTVECSNYSNTIPRVRYAECIESLSRDGINITWGDPLQSSHETMLCQKFHGPIFVTNYPADSKAFYFKKCQSNLNEAECFDFLVPNIGEIAGGGLRENNYDVLLENIRRKNINPTPLQWYLDLRKLGHPPTGGFGIGIERLLTHLLKLNNIRDTVHFPRYEGPIKS